MCGCTSLNSLFFRILVYEIDLSGEVEPPMLALIGKLYLSTGYSALNVNKNWVFIGHWMGSDNSKREEFLFSQFGPFVKSNSFND